MKKVHKRFAALFLAAVLLLTGMMPAAADQNAAQAPVTSESSKTQEAAGTGTDAEVSPVSVGRSADTGRVTGCRFLHFSG